MSPSIAVATCWLALFAALPGQSCTVTEDALVGWYGAAPDAASSHWITWAGDGGLLLYDRASVDTRRLAIVDGALSDEDIRIDWSVDCAAAALRVGSTRLVRIDSSMEQRNVRYGDDLAALILIPASPVAGVVYIHGAGESDRDHPQFLELALTLAERNIAYLLTDKRGSGRSGGDFSTVDFHTFAEDAAAGMTLVRDTVPDGAPVGVLGLSQGGWVVPLMTGTRYDADFGVILSGAGVRLAEQQRHIVKLTAERMGLSAETEAQLQRLLARGERFAHSGEDWNAYAQLREELLTGEGAPIASLLPSEPDAAAWRVARNTWYLDPALELAQADVDVLMVLGEEDEKQNIPVAESRRRISAMAPEVALIVFPGLGHGLSDARHTGTHPAVLELVADWILAHTDDAVTAAATPP